MGDDMQTKMRELRKQQKMSFKELSLRSNVSIAHLRRVEKGESDPTLTTMLKIAWGLRKEVWEVFGTQKN